MRYFVLLSGLTVAACGGSGGGGTPPIEVGPATEEIGGRVATVSFDATTGEYTAEIGGLSRQLAPLPTFDNGTFVAARGIGGASADGFYLSESDASTILLYRPDPGDLSGGPSVALTRLGDSTVPTRGSATITGDYVALLQDGAAGDPLAVIDGDGRWGGELLPANPERLAIGNIGNHVLEFRAHGWPPMSGNAYSMNALLRVLPIPAEEYRQAADSFLNEQVAVCGQLARSDEPVAAYREHGGNQFAGTEVDLGWLRTKIRRELCSHERLGNVAWQLGLNDYKANPADVRDVSFVGYRLASLRLDPIGHPIVDRMRPDGRVRLAVSGIRAALTNPQLAPSDRVIRCVWFATIAAAPAAAVPQLLSWYLPDGPSQPIWRRRRRARQQSTALTVLVPPSSAKDENGGTCTNR